MSVKIKFKGIRQLVKLPSTKYAQIESNDQTVVQQENWIDINIHTDIICLQKHRTESINSICFIQYPCGSK